MNTSPEAIAYLLITGCPGCSDDVDVDDLCEHDDPETGPLCQSRCCPREHLLQVLKVRAA